MHKKIYYLALLVLITLSTIGGILAELEGIGFAEGIIGTYLLLSILLFATGKVDRSR